MNDRRGRPLLVALALALALGLGLVPLLAHAQGAVVVRPGDTLSAIARRHGVTVADLVQANGLDSPDVLFAGQRLVVPGVGQVPVSLGVTVPGVHVVRAGETLYAIALRHGTTIGALVAANNLTSADVVYAGQRLVLPGPSGIGRPEAAVPAPGAGGRHVVVSLGNQTLTAYDGATVAASFVISSGKAWTPTPLGRFRIYSRYASQRMIGPGYDLPGVPYVQYFVGNYALHGAYWHDRFGVPTSHGCVNLRVADAAWLWGWANLGTEVWVEP